MNRKTVYCMLIIAALVLASVVVAQDKKAPDQATQVQPVAPAKAREQAAQPQVMRQTIRDRIAAEIERIKADQKKEIDELQAIKQLATEEKATKTIEALTKYIEKQNARFEQQVQRQQQQLNAIQNMETRQGAQVQPPAKPPTDTKAAPAEPKKEAPAAEPKKDTEKKAQ